MNLLPVLATWQFALAGALCALAPLVIHLLNRRRFRVLNWAAMAFVREALQHQRRILRLRDLLLLVLRTAAVLLFGVALARPYFAASREKLADDEPVHAVLLIDNSLSMGYQTLAGTLLEEAQRRAAALIEQLPLGSRISLVPMCGSTDALAREPYDTKRLALDALRRIAVVDRSASLAQALNEARRTADAGPRLAQRFVLFSDQQRINWKDFQELGQAPDLPALQIVELSAEDRDNTWVADLRIPDGIADAETPCMIVATIRHRGRKPRGDVRVALSVNGQEIESQVVQISTPDATREVTFPFTFREFQPATADPAFVPVAVSLSPDRLVEDDRRQILAPVVAVLPVVFVDQYGAEGERPAENRLGESRPLRQLLAPLAAQVDAARQLVQVRHVRIEQLDRSVLSEARLAVIAGIRDPGDKVDLLREYVEQGGQLVVAAGAEFDAVAWNDAAWRKGAGILPLPLSPEPLGSLPELAATELQPFQLSFESLRQHPFFQLAGVAEEELRDLYAEPFFFKAVKVREGEQLDAGLLQATRDQLRAGLSDVDSQQPAGEQPRPEQSRPAWLQWAPPVQESTAQLAHLPLEERQSAIERIAHDQLPRILARFSSEQGPAFLVERKIGRGRVMLVASGLLSRWNTLTRTNAIVLFDRMLRSMIEATISQRQYPAVDRIVVPIPGEYRQARLLLDRPGGEDGVAEPEQLDLAWIAPGQLGGTIDRPLRRGFYRLRIPTANEDSGGSIASRPAWQFELAVNGDADESELDAWNRATFDQQLSGNVFSWVGLNEPIRLAGMSLRGQELWWWLACAVLVLLLGELFVLAGTNFQSRGRPFQGADR